MTENSLAPAEEKPRKKTHSERAIFTIFIFVVAGYAIIILYAMQSASMRQFFAILGSGLLTSGACLLGGALLGFLFGIPRTSQDDKPEDKEAKKNTASKNDAASGPVQSNSYKPNTNLEQISDWLTKIIVGVGLIQIYRLPGVLRSYANYIAPGLGNFPSAKIFALSILFFYLIDGFLIGYLWTRLYFAGALREADFQAVGNKLEAMEHKLTEIEQQAQIDAKALAIVQRQMNPGFNAEPISQDELNAAIAPSSSNIKSQIYYIVHNIRSDNWVDMETKPVMERTIPVFRALVASDKENVFHLNHGQLGFALKDQRKPDWKEAEVELSKAIDIRGSWKDKGWLLYEFNRALCNIELDSNIHAGAKSNKTYRDKILADLKSVKSSSSLYKVACKDKLIRKWLEINE